MYCSIFNIFSETDYFCLKEKKELNCSKCLKSWEENSYYKQPLIIINKDYLNYDSINSIFIDKSFSDDLQQCKYCFNDNFNKKTCRVYYNIVDYSKIIFFILDIEPEELLSEYNNIMKIFKYNIEIDNNKYELISIICYKNKNHFTCYINKVADNFDYYFDNKIDKDLKYYHDGCNENGLIKTIDSINDLYNIYKAYPYIFVYKK